MCGIDSGFLCLSLPSSILIPDKIALCTALSLQNFSVVSNNHCWSIDGTCIPSFKLFKMLIIFLCSSSVIVFKFPISIAKDSLLGNLLYLTTN